jgi:hypothetical protein
MCVTPALTNASPRRPDNSSNTPALNWVDFEQPRREHLFDLPVFVRKWAIETLLRRKDERNFPIFLVGMNILLTSVPLAMGLFYLEGRVPTSVSIGLGIAYFACHLKTFARSFILALHYITHCSIFNRDVRFLDNVFTSFICVFFGIGPGLYYPHHIAMHHAEENVAPLDISSTMNYTRGSKFHHFLYMFRFVALGFIELPYVMFLKGHYNLFVQCIVGSMVHWGGMAWLGSHSPVATFFVFWFPWLFVSFSLMQGNFKEHIFVDPDDHMNNYKSAISCINCHSNSLTFNTGYHIEHHEEPGLPWFKLPELFIKNLSKHAENDSFIFSGIGPMEIGTLALNGRFEEMADYYLNVGQPKRTKVELVAEFKRRLVPVTFDCRGLSIAQLVSANFPRRAKE